MIPAELLIGGTFWSALTMVGDLEDGCNHLHVDGHDVVSLIIQVGPDVDDLALPFKLAVCRNNRYKRKLPLVVNAKPS